jgi:hypothetical protein
MSAQPEDSSMGGVSDGKGKGKAIAEDIPMEEEEESSEEEEEMVGTFEIINVAFANANSRIGGRTFVHSKQYENWDSHANIKGIAEEEDEDNMEEIDTNNIIASGRRTRGKTIDFAKAAENAEDLPEDEDDDEDFEEPKHEGDAMEE